VTFVAGVIGYIIGSLPTAALLGQMSGVDLRAQGSGNPGTFNAMRTSGPLLAALVLIVEAAKGLAAVWVGEMLAGDTGALVAGLGAVAGNVYNVWYRFQGGKGVGISLGVLIGLWPTVILPIMAVIGLGALITRSSGIATLVAIVALLLMAVLWTINEWPSGGLATDPALLVLATGIGLLVFWKHWRALAINEPSHP
jgi:glycerol-3-phosphate acyltransferase PlsY